MFKRTNIFLYMLLLLILTACSAGTNSMNQRYTFNVYLVFSESNITLSPGESAEITLSLINTDIVPLSPLNLYSSESDIVTLTPDICVLEGSPLSCNFVITAIQPGSTQISATGVAPGQPMSVTVTP